MTTNTIAIKYIVIAMHSMCNASSAEAHTEIDKAHLQLTYTNQKQPIEYEILWYILCSQITPNLCV